MAAARPILLLTRPQASSEAFWYALPEDIRAAVDILINPLLSIHFKGPLPDLSRLGGLIFTSANALDAYIALNGRVLNVPVIAVGAATGKAARDFGFDVDVAGGTAEHLIAHVLERGYKGPLLHLRGEIAIGDIAQRLTAAGVATDDAVLYRQKPKPFTAPTRVALSQDRPVVAPIFSPRTAVQFGRESKGLANIGCAAISQAVADALPVANARRTQIASQPDRAGMVELVTNMIADAAGLERRL